MNTRDKLAAARLMAAQKMPYFRTAILGMVPKQAPGLGTFGTTKTGVMLWDPAVAEVWSVEEIAAVLVHEVSHLLRRHNDRRERLQADPMMWNHAADEEINDDLEHAGLKLPTKPFEPVTPASYGHEEGLTAEEYYRDLLQKAMAAKIEMSGGGEQGQEEKNSQKGNGSDGKGKSKGAVAAGHCGSCAGHAVDGEDPDGDKDGRSEVDLDRIRRTVAESIRKEASKGRGTVPEGWTRWANQELAPPKIPWRQKLARLARAAMAYRPGAVDYHWTRPSRRQAGVGFGPGRPILPALRQPLPRVAVVIDTSGSMGDMELGSAVSECRGVLNAAGADVDLCACDAEVHELRKVTSWKEIPALIKGGGGTNMKPALEALAQRRPRPDVVVVMTDGQIGDAGPQPSFRVIWLILGRYGNTAPAPWGDVVVIDESLETSEESAA